MRQKRSLCYSLRTVNVAEERQEEYCDLWVRLLFDTWRHSSVHIPRCDYFLDKYKEHAEVMIVPQCVEKLLEHRSGNREEIQLHEYHLGAFFVIFPLFFYVFGAFLHLSFSIGLLADF